MRHALADTGGDFRRLLGGRADAAGRGGRRSVGTVAMSATDLLHPPPRPIRTRKPARRSRRGHIHWLRLIVIALVLIRILAALPGLAWSRLAGTGGRASPPRMD
jgi:hypothetical protein